MSRAMIAVSALCVLAFAPPARGDDAADADAKLKDYLGTIKGAEAARITPLTGDGVAEAFPDHALFAVMFPQYPLARVAPEPLQSANVIAVPKKKGGKPVALTNLKELQTFFAANARDVKKTADADDVVKAWLRAAAELNQDGFYKFTVTAEPATAAGETVTATGTAAVAPQGGNKGTVAAKLAFEGGKLVTADTKVDLKPGIRPICQATKLLDPDPIVRGMAEQSIRVMGSAARPYLDEQRAKAPPELRKAIDKVWAQIVAEDR